MSNISIFFSYLDLLTIRSRDPLTVNLASTDIPARRIKKDLKRYLNDDEQFKALESLPAFEAFIFEASRLFFKRISKTYN